MSKTILMRWAKDEHYIALVSRVSGSGGEIFVECNTGIDDDELSRHCKGSIRDTDLETFKTLVQSVATWARSRGYRQVRIELAEGDAIAGEREGEEPNERTNQKRED